MINGRRQLHARSRWVVASLAVVLSVSLMSTRSWGDEPGPRTWKLSNGHTQEVLDLGFSADSKTLASSSRDGTVKLWDLATGAVRSTLRPEPESWVYLLDVSPDGKTLALASGKHWARDEGHVVAKPPGLVTLWDADTGKMRARLSESSGEVGNLAFSEDGKRLATVSNNGTVWIWDTDTGKALSNTKLSIGRFYSARSAISPDLKTIAVVVGLEHQTIQLIDIASGHERAMLQGHHNSVMSMAFSADSRSLASGAGRSMGSRGGSRGNFPTEVKVWDLSGETPREQASLLGLSMEVADVAFSPDARLVAAVGSLGSQVKVWDVESGATIANLKPSASDSSSVAFSPDGALLASSGWTPALSLWDTKTWSKGSDLTGRTAYQLAYTPDGDTLAAGLSDGGIALWDVERGQETAVLQGHTQPVRALACSPDARRLASGSVDGTISLWNPETHGGGSALVGHAGEVTCLAFAPSGTILASGGKDASVRLWDVVSHRQVGRLNGHESEVSGVAFLPDGKTLVSTSLDGTIRLWNVETLQERSVSRGLTMQVPKTREEKSVINGETTTFRVAIPGETEPRGVPIESLAVSPDGNTLAIGFRMVGSTIGGVSLRDARTLEEHVAFAPTTGGNHPTVENVYALSFSPDSKLLAVPGYHTLRIAAVDSGKVLAVLDSTAFFGPIRDVRFSPDGKTLTSCGSQVVQFWDVEAALKQANGD